MNVIVPQHLIGKEITSIELNHPRTGEPTVYFYCGDELFEVVRYQSPLGCLFVGESVQQASSFHTLTKANSVLLSLHILAKNNKQFKALGDLLEAQEATVLKPFLLKDQESLESVNDVKEVDDEKYYRFSLDKTISWLEKKVGNVIEAIKEKGISVSSKSAGVSGLLVSAKASEEDSKRFAFSLIREYLPEPIIEELRRKLNLPEESQLHSSPLKSSANGNDNNDSKGAPKEDYYKSPSKEEKASKEPKNLTRAQKQLLKVDKTGMKSITSFFTKTSK